MDGWTLDSIDEPEGESVPERIDAELERIAAGAAGAPHILPLRPDDPSWPVRVGDERESVLCDETSLLAQLKELADGAPLGSVWRVLRAEAQPATDQPH